MAFHKKQEKEWLSVNDIVEKTNWSRDYIINQIKSGKLKAFRPERVYRIKSEWYEEWIRGGMYA